MYKFNISKYLTRSILLSGLISTATIIANLNQVQAESLPTISPSSSSQKIPPNLPQVSDESTLIQTLSTLSNSEINPETNANAEHTTDVHAQNITSVSQLSDVKPTDWAFTALQSLVERYGCIAGYPDRTYKGSRSTSRYEFAAGLNACLDKINELLSSGLADKVSKADLATLQKLQEEFASELAMLRGRVDALEAKNTTLQEQQFSPTTKLWGLTYMTFTGATASGLVQREVGARNPVTGKPITEFVNDPNTTFSYFTWLVLTSTFTGKDKLVTQLVAGNSIAPADTFNSAGFRNTTGVAFETPGVGTNTVELMQLNYEFPILNDKVRITVGPRIIWYITFDTNRFTFPLFYGGSFNSINSTLSSPVKHGAGAILDTSLASWLDLKVGYLAEANNFKQAKNFVPGTVANSAPDPREGLFGGDNIFSTQFTIKPSRDFNLRLLYNRVNQQGFGGLVGSLAPINGLVDDGAGGGLVNGQSDVFIANFDWLVSQGFGLFGRYSISNSNLNPINPATPKGNLTAQSYQIGLAFPDLFKEGAVGTISFLMPFNYTSGKNFLVSGSGDGGTQYDLEFSYSLPITRNIVLVPQLYMIFNPNNFSSNPTITVGSFRISYSF